MTIEPCCAERQLRLLRDSIGHAGTREFEGYGDLSLTELLPALLARYSESEMIIVAPTLPLQASEIIEKWLRKQWARMDGKGKLNVLRHLTIITDLRKKKSPQAFQWQQVNPFVGRLTLVDKRQDDTVLLLPDFAIVGPVNMRYDQHFVATATTDAKTIGSLWAMYR